MQRCILCWGIKDDHRCDNGLVADLELGSLNAVDLVMACYHCVTRSPL